MKKLLNLLILTFLFATLNAQIKIEVGPQFNGPSGEDFSAGIGGIINASYMVSKSMEIGLSFGYQHLIMKNGWEALWFKKWGYAYSDADYNIRPIRATMKYYFGEKNLRPYAGVETGFTKLNERYSYIYSGYGKLTDESSNSHFAMAPQVGFEMSLGKLFSFDLNVKYNGFDLNYLSVKTGLILKFGNK